MPSRMGLSHSLSLLHNRDLMHKMGVSLVARTVLLRTVLLLSFAVLIRSFPYDPSLVDYNLNQNQSTQDPRQYWGQWDGHSYNPSPANWRFPYYTLFLDRFVNGDPSNDNINGTLFEHDITQTQLRHGGDVQGLVDSLDYIQGAGIKAIYLAGSPFINLPWESDGYSPIDFTLLDAHFGNIQMWRDAITEIHRRGMYVVLDNTFATMSDLIGFEGYLNTTTPFSTSEYNVQWKTSRQYRDFGFGNEYNATCSYPRFYNETGLPVGADVTNQLLGCYNSDFDQYGDMEAFGVHPDWQRELTKFASVQDRLREWVPDVRARIQRHACIAINMLDIDGYRLDKATQSTVDAQGAFSAYTRECAQRLGKNNFMVVGEITGGNTFGSIYVGRGRLSDTNMWPENATAALTANNHTADKYYIREPGQQALDAAAFHYSIYRTLTRFLGMDGNLEAGFDLPRNWVDAWNEMIITNDMVNAQPGGPNGFDPRHLYGVTNQDVFRWPAIANGTERQLLGHFITVLHMPGSPLLLWGEEQAFYTLDNTAPNYIYGRQSMSSAQAWQQHGCYKLGSVQYYQWPLDKALTACHDDWNSLDHRDPSAPVRNILKSMFQMRQNFPVLNDGFLLQQLSNITRFILLPGSTDTPTEIGVWSTLRSRFTDKQDFSHSGSQGNQSVWLVYHNDNKTVTYNFDCKNNDTALNTTALIAPFDSGVTVKNLFHPYDEQTLKDSPRQLGFEGSKKPNGCLDSLTFPAWGFAAYVPADQWKGPGPMVSGFVPGHDARIKAPFAAGGHGSIPIELHFTTEMNCDSVTKSLKINSTTADGNAATLDSGSVHCGNITNPAQPTLVGALPSVWNWSATLTQVGEGVHQITIVNVSAASGNLTTGSTDHFLLRVGQPDNPVVFPSNASYAPGILQQAGHGTLYVTPNAPGADKVRYSMDFGSTYSDWQLYNSQRMTLNPSNWTGSSSQAWDGQHVILQYWSRLAGSSDHVQHSDLDPSQTPRQYPHLFWEGPYNQFGFDAGLNNVISQDPADSLWKYNFFSEWPDYAQINVWGIDPNGQPDSQFVFGDVDGDSVLDRSLPNALSQTTVNITSEPPSPFLAWQFQLDDKTNHFQLIPVGNRWLQLVMFILLALIPPLTAALAVYMFVKSFYQVKFNRVGLSDKTNALTLAMRRVIRRKGKNGSESNPLVRVRAPPEGMKVATNANALSVLQPPSERRKVLIATMEYDIEDWGAKVKIGGLGVMAQLMGKHLGHQDLIWVVPKVGDIDYKQGEPAEPMQVRIFDEVFEIEVQTHVLRNITYVLLDAPVFRKQMKAEPYPPRMDDLDSGIYYSAWNQAIAIAIERYQPHLYHINDYHGAVAPLHLLRKGKTIPVCLSLHNAEFQGLWPMRTPDECKEVCSVFNLPYSVVRKYVQFGEVFNLLHAGSSYLRIHQHGFGAVGVSKKYGKRSFARYPIFWGLDEIGQLPNPDPSDTDEWDGKLLSAADVPIDTAFEAGRAELKRQAQEWAGLNQDPEAELMVFVGRWSMQKGVDLIADVFPPILEKNSKVQLVCIGPVIDLYGKFAALKLERMMSLYPGRVFSKPEFTALPPYIFSGAEFALIPSRDEPFGLVAVEFGRKGALGVGSRVGGLGQMPGWWYTVESTTTAHLLQQFRTAILDALHSDQATRAQMRARSAKQRFPVVQWVTDLETLQSTSIKQHSKVATKAARSSHRFHPWLSFDGQPSSARSSGALLPSNRRSSGFFTQSRESSPHRHHYRFPSQSDTNASQPASRPVSENFDGLWMDGDGERGRKKRGFGLSISFGRPGHEKTLSLGMPTGPGHSGTPRHRSRERSRLQSRRQSRNPSRNTSAERARGRSRGRDRENRISFISAPNSRHPSPRPGSSQLPMPPVPRFHVGPARSPAMSMYSVDGEDAATPGIRPNEVTISREEAELAIVRDEDAEQSQTGTPSIPSMAQFPRPISANLTPGQLSPHVGSPRAVDGITSVPLSPAPESPLPTPPAPMRNAHFNRSNRDLSLVSIVGDRTDYHLQKVDPFFTDASGEYYDMFKGRLEDLNGKNSEGTLCIEEYLVKVEKLWFRRFKDAKLGLASQYSGKYVPVDGSTPAISPDPSRRPSRTPSPTNRSDSSSDRGREGPQRNEKECYIAVEDEFMLGANYEPPTGVRNFMQRRIGDWPIYAFFLAFGQIIAANSYQITLLTGTVGESAQQLYIIATVYLVTSILWWLAFRRLKAVYVLSLPFVFYGLAFLLIGLAHFLPTIYSRGVMQTLGTVCYATASSSGSIFFALNFADEGGAPVAAWLYRACVIQGTQSAYVIALWYWGAELTKETASGLSSNSYYPMTTLANSWRLTAATIPIAVLMWAVGLTLLLGLPTYYRQTPGQVPSFYASVFRRRIIIWFFIAVALQNFWLSAPYGRNWAYLWSSQHAPGWAIALLCVLFFGFVWAAFLLVFGRLSKDHSWILPLFAIGLGAPRWAQMLWGVSNIGKYIPWAGTPLASAMLGRSLWLWLGVLDSLQGVGIGMILLQTLTRFHIAFTLLAAQVVGSIFTIMARGVAPDNLGPGPVFPDFSVDIRAGLSQPWFWVALICQGIVCVGFFVFFRKEQLSKP